MFDLDCDGTQVTTKVVHHFENSVNKVTSLIIGYKTRVFD